MEWQDYMELSDCVPRMQRKNSEPFGEEIVLLFFFFYLTRLRNEFSALETMRAFCTGKYLFEMYNSEARRIYLV